MRIDGWRLLAALGVLSVAIGVAAWSIGPANAAIESYDLTMRVTRTTTNGIKLRDRMTGELTVDPVTGATTFDVGNAEVPKFRIRGTGLLSRAERSIGHTTYDGFADPDPTPRFTGTALFFGTFKRGRARFVGKLSAVADDNGTAPQGYTYTVGRVTAVRR